VAGFAVAIPSLAVAVPAAIPVAIALARTSAAVATTTVATLVAIPGLRTALGLGLLGFWRLDFGYVSATTKQKLLDTGKQTHLGCSRYRGHNSGCCGFGLWP